MIETDSMNSPVVVEDLTEDWLLGLVEESETQSRTAERRKLRYAHQWAILHPAADPADAATWGDLGGRDRDCNLTLGGDGSPLVAAFTAEPFAVALGVSTRAGMALIADALDLVHRLRRTHRLVESLQVAPWRARWLAPATRTLSKEAAAYVDREIAPVLDSCGPTRIDRLVEKARASFDQIEQAEEEGAQQADWGVRLHHAPSGRYAGTSMLEITGDTPTLTRFHDEITKIAHDLLDPDDPTSPDLNHRKIAALGVIVDRALGADTTNPSNSGAKTRLYLHMDADHLPDPTLGLGSAERLGPLTLDLIKQWLQQSRVSIQPVLRMDRGDAVDQHDPPAWMRELVTLRDRRCVYPYCERNSRDCDLDHIKAYLAMNDGGPPGQTNPDNLAPLCRRHHRAKTHGGWRYRRNPDGTYTWYTPHARALTVWPDGTVRAH
jgi:hypothetical protein